MNEKKVNFNSRVANWSQVAYFYFRLDTDGRFRADMMDAERMKQISQMIIESGLKGQPLDEMAAYWSMRRSATIGMMR
jgi:hypothetical protein